MFKLSWIDLSSEVFSHNQLYMGLSRNLSLAVKIILITGVHNNITDTKIKIKTD